MRLISNTISFRSPNYPSNSYNALHLFAYIPSHSMGYAFLHSSVHELPRTTMSYHPYLTRSKFKISRRNHQTSTRPSPLPITSSNVPQLSDEWFTLRKNKLTTSTFSTALGFWKGDTRSKLWHEKLFLPDPMLSPSSKAAMDWGVRSEPKAIEKYKAITGQEVSFLGFATHNESKFDWLGASPDGLLDRVHEKGGILEVKCPYNKGRPEHALPWKAVPYYYMPQVQGQMEVMDRDWVDLYCWTLNGSVVFRVSRDKGYWEMMEGVLREFWWGNVVPAKEALQNGRDGEVRVYEPKKVHELTELIVRRSKELAVESKMVCRDIGGCIEFFE